MLNSYDDHNVVKINLDMKAVKTQSDLNEIINALSPFAELHGFADALEAAAKRLNGAEFKIAVVANMSSGKSTFINALFGDDVLPALNEATTDCATFIYSDDIEENNKAVIYFEDNREQAVIPAEAVRDEIRHYARKDDDGIDKKYHKVCRIDLHWDFMELKNRQNMRFTFTFIDTPGPNNTGDFEEKHKNTTNEIIREEADLVIFLFDYGQLDANLKSDEQGLWEIIKLRSNQDEFFDVFFVINKIDMALEDDEKMDVEKGTYKEKAIEKLRECSIQHGFVDNPKIFGVSAKLSGLYRIIKEKTSINDESSMRKYRKQFKAALLDFDDEPNPEKAMLDYSGISTLENHILNYIKDTIEKKLVSRVRYEIHGVISNIENNFLQTLSVLSKDANEAKQNLDKGLSFLEREMPAIRNSLNLNLNNAKDEFLEYCSKQIDYYLKKYFELEIEQIVLKACRAAYHYYICMYVNKKQAIIKANEQKTNIQSNNSTFWQRQESIEIISSRSDVKEETFVRYCYEFIEERLKEQRQKATNDYRLSILKYYSALVSNIKDIYAAKLKELNLGINAALSEGSTIRDIEAINIPTIEFVIPQSCVQSSEMRSQRQVNEGYRTEATEKKEDHAWYNPLRWVGVQRKEIITKKIPILRTIIDKKLKISIDFSEIIEALQNQCQELAEIWKSNDIPVYEDSINQLIDKYIQRLDEIETRKINDIEKIKSELGDREKNVNELYSEYAKFSEALNNVPR